MSVAQRFQPRVPDDFDVTRPNIARINNYLLFGKDHFAVDRAVADELAAAGIEPRQLALANRAFLRRAVRAVANRGVGQFLDLGCGLPTPPTVDEVARQVNADARVSYVDHDPARTAYKPTLTPFSVRTREQITRFFDGFELLEPGVACLTEWRPDTGTDRTPLKIPVLCGVGTLPSR